MKVVAISSRTVLVEIPKTRFYDASANWLNNDHLEVWQAIRKSKLEYSSPLLGWQWGVQLSNGRVIPALFRAENSEDAETARYRQEIIHVEEVVRDETDGTGVTLFKITLPEPLDDDGDDGYLTISYSEADQTRGVLYLLSTSELCFGRMETLGSTKWINPAWGRCEVTDGVLNVNPVTSFDPDTPIIGRR